jgi:hypothetical protein
LRHRPKVTAYRIAKVRTKARRRYDCLHYHECLTKAAHDIAPSLPCEGCPHYEKDDKPFDLIEYGGILMLLQEVFRDDLEQMDPEPSAHSDFS